MPDMPRSLTILATLSLAIALFVVGCASPASQPTLQSPVAATSTTAAAAAATATTAIPTSTATSSTPSSVSGAIRYDVASGTTASYRVREQLARLNAPSDAVGKTSAVTGSIVITPDLKIVSDQS